VRERESEEEERVWSETVIDISLSTKCTGPERERG